MMRRMDITTVRSPAARTARTAGAATSWSGTPRWLSWLLALGGVGVVNAVLSADATSPVQTKDEIGYLMAGRLLGGGGGADLVTPPYAGGYSAGWGLLLAPLWGPAGGPERFFQLGIAVNVLTAVLAVVVWAAVARRLGAQPPTALAVAAVVGVAPGRALYTGYALPEALVGLLVAVAFLLVLRLWDDDGPVAARTATALALAGVAAYLALAHSRFLPTVALLLGVLAWWAWRSRPPRAAVAVVGGTAVLGVLGAVALNQWVEDVLYGEVDRFAVAGDQVGNLHIGYVTSLVLGHAWYGAVAWVGLSVVGLLWTLLRAREEWRRRSPGPAVLLVLVCAAQLVVGAAYLSTRIGVGAGRLDQVVYGRYTDPVWALLALVGLTALVTGGARTAVLRTAVRVVAVLGAAAAVVLLCLGGIVGGLVQLNVPGIEMWRWQYGDQLHVPWLQATLAALLVLAGLRWARSRSVPVAVVLTVVAALALTGTFVAEDRTIDARDENLRSLFTLRETVEEAPGAPVLLVVDRPLLLTGTAFQYWLGDRQPRVLDPSEDALKVLPGELVIGARWPRPLFIGAPTRLVEVDPSGRYAVWRAEGGTAGSPTTR